MPATTGSTTTGKALQISSIPTLNGVNYTFIAWYKGTQTDVTMRQYSPAVPIFGDPRGSVYLGFGLEGGCISVAEHRSVKGGVNVADGNWHMLTWTISSSNNKVNAWVDGYQQIWDYAATIAPTNNAADFIGQGYPYASQVSPTALDGVQVYNQVLTQTQIREIYANGVGIVPFAKADPYIYRRYWRVRVGAATNGSHHPRISRVIVRDKDQTDYTLTTYTADNCGDSGTILSGGETFVYDAGAGNTKAMVGAGFYTVYSGERSGMWYLDYSSDNSTWTEMNSGDMRSSRGCGYYFTSGPNATKQMPGYLSNRLIAFIPAEKAAVDAAIEIIQGDIDDLSLNLGV
jgi:hypothetical protein